MIDAKRCECPLCGAIFASTEMLTAPHPFKPSSEILGCPGCRETVSLLSFNILCDTEGCERLATAYVLTLDGGRYTCESHRSYAASCEAAKEHGG